MPSSMRYAFVSALTLAASVCLPALSPQVVQAQNAGDTGSPIILPRTNTGAPARNPMRRKEPTLEDILVHKDMPFEFIQPVSLEGIKIPGLNAKALRVLGFNHFVVVNNTPFKSMSELYRDNRMKGKGNMVTADSLVHPYFSTTNGLLSAVIEEHLYPDLRALLNAMLQSSIADYRASEDGEVRDDIQRNLAFLSVAMQLLEPSLKLPDMGGATDLAATDLAAVKSGKSTRSAIFDRIEDFSYYTPQGWYNTSPRLQNFFRARQWLSRMYFPLTDVTSESSAGGGNEFRRSMLIFRSLDRSMVDGHPALEMWQKLTKAWSLFGLPNQASQGRTLLATDVKSVTQTGTTDLKRMLEGLSEPLFRTKLLLTVRNQKQVGLGATSIFELQDKNADSGSNIVFRLMPLIQEPELDWLKARGRHCREDEQGATWSPLALCDLHAWGAQQATNVLAAKVAFLDPGFSKWLPDLERTIARARAGQVTPLPDRRWEILSAYFKSFPDGSQPVLRSEHWATRRLESAFAGWLDGQLAINQIEITPGHAQAASDSNASTTAGAAAANGTKATTTSGTAPTVPATKPANFHFLEPCIDLYQKVQADTQRLAQQLDEMGYFPQRYRERLQDFARLSQRFKSISETEVSGHSIAPMDFKLLANIDQVLEKVESPLPGSIYLADSLSNASEQANKSGVSLTIGRPGLLCMILPTTQGATLVRGAVYTYYETPGGPIKAEHLARKLEFGMLRPPTWLNDFDVVIDDQATNKSATAGKEASLAPGR